jgi:hypothetical protein
MVNPLRTPPPETTAFDELGFFDVTCVCGSKAWHVMGYPKEEGAFLCPLSLKCESCLRVTSLFDIEKDGYDAELGNGCYSLRGEGEPEAFTCPHCKAATFGVFPSFSYQIEPIDDMSAEEQSHIQDYFDGFGLHVRCIKCGELEDLVSYECA